MTLSPITIGLTERALPKDWQWTLLLDLAKLESGHTPRKSVDAYWEGGTVPWISLQDIRAAHGQVITETKHMPTEVGIANSSARLLPAGTVCFSRDISVGYTTIMGREMATTQHFANWICGPRLYNRYLMHALMASRGDLIQRGEGSTVRTIYMPALMRFHLALPPIEVQHAIVAKLESIQVRSKRARAALAAVTPLLEKLRQSILAAAFRGDLTKEWRAKNPDVEPASELLKRIRVERRRKWEEAELAKMTAKGKAPTDDRWKAKYKEPAPVDAAGLPELPAGWCWATIDLVGDVLLGRRRAAEEYIAGQDGRTDRPYVRVANVKEDRLALDDVLVMPFNEQELQLYRLKAGDIVLSEGQSPELVGQSAIFTGGFDDLCIQATVHRFRAFESATTSEFAQLVFLDHLHSGVFQRAASLTTNIAHLTSERLRPLRFPLPPRVEQARIVELARRSLGRVGGLEDTLRSGRTRNAQLERALLAKAFSGALLGNAGAN